MHVARLAGLFVGAALSIVPAVAGDIRIAVSEAGYAPATVGARLGDALVFVNEGAAEHAVFVPTVGHAVSLGVQKPGETRRLPLAKAGRFEVECVVHADMRLVVEVRP